MIVVQFANCLGDVFHVSTPSLQRLVRYVCKRFGLTTATISVAVVDDAQFRKLNAQFLKRTRSSDCLSFDLSETKTSAIRHRQTGTRRTRLSPPVAEAGRVFELVINGDAAVTEASRRGHSPEAELALYVVHSLLHQLGFNDSTWRQACKMHKAEDEILRSLGYGAVYCSRREKSNIKKQISKLTSASSVEARNPDKSGRSPHAERRTQEPEVRSQKTGDRRQKEELRI